MIINSCPKCSAVMLKRKGPFGEFWGCIRFPTCKGTRHIHTLQDNTPDPTAGDELKKLRMEAHRKLKEFCDKLGRKKQSAYKTLSKRMKIPLERTHFGMFNEKKCKEAIEILDGILK